MANELNDVLALARQEDLEIPSDSDTHELADMVDELVVVRDRIAELEDMLKREKETERRISTERIPSKMDEIGVMGITTPNGRKVAVQPFYSGKIRPEAEDRAFEWIEQSGHGGVIKGEAVFAYRRNQREDILKFLADVKDQYGFEANIKLGVHHSTFRALLRELVEDDGVVPPPDLFDVFIGRQTKIK